MVTVKTTEYNDAAGFEINRWCSAGFTVNPLISGDKKKVTHTQVSLQLKAAGLFKYVWPFCYHQVLKV